MRTRRIRVGALLLAAGALLAGADGAAARIVRVPPQAGAAQAALDAASPGDEVVLLTGVHPGPLHVDRAVVLRGGPGAVVDGGGRGTVIRVLAPGASLEDLTVRGSGRRLLTGDAGIYVGNAAGVALRRLRLVNVLYGIYVERGEHLVVDRCHLTGTSTGEEGEGNGIHLWYTHDAWLHGNTVEQFQDAVYLAFAFRTRVDGCTLHDCSRYGFHTMYCQENQLLENVFARNVAGCAIMFSNHLAVVGNAFLHNRGPRTYGLLLRDCSDGEFLGNRLIDNTIAVFMDNSNRNRIEGNLLQDNGWGLLIFSSCAGNVVAENTFLHNDYPVSLDMRTTDNRFDDGRRGNFWSENAPYDLDGDGVSDIPYSPVTAFAFLSKQFPDLAILAASPAVTALTAAERVFPALRPSEAVDRYPLVAPAPVRVGAGFGAAGAGGGPAVAGGGAAVAAAVAPSRASIPAAAGFGGLLLAGLAGLGFRWRR